MRAGTNSTWMMNSRWMMSVPGKRPPKRRYPNHEPTKGMDSTIE